LKANRVSNDWKQKIWHWHQPKIHRISNSFTFYSKLTCFQFKPVPKSSRHSQNLPTIHAISSIPSKTNVSVVLSQQTDRHSKQFTYYFHKFSCVHQTIRQNISWKTLDPTPFSNSPILIALHYVKNRGYRDQKIYFYASYIYSSTALLSLNIKNKIIVDKHRTKPNLRDGKRTNH
jgi:hypothetical protein